MVITFISYCYTGVTAGMPLYLVFSISDAKKKLFTLQKLYPETPAVTPVIQNFQPDFSIKKS